MNSRGCLYVMHTFFYLRKVLGRNVSFASRTWIEFIRVSRGWMSRFRWEVRPIATWETFIVRNVALERVGSITLSVLLKNVLNVMVNFCFVDA